jgi:hypothetical protein
MNMLDIIEISFWIIQNNYVGCFNQNSLVYGIKKNLLNNTIGFTLFVNRKCSHLCLTIFIGFP